MSNVADAIVAALVGLLCFVAALVINQPWCWSLLALGAGCLGYSVHAIVTERRGHHGQLDGRP